MNLYATLGGLIYLQYPDSAIYFTNKGIEISELIPIQNRDSVYIALKGALLNNSAFLHQRTGDIYNSILLYQQCIQIQEEVGDTTNASTAYLNLGSLYLSVDELDLAMKYTQIAVKIIAPNEFVGIAKCRMTLGGIFDKQGDYDKALNQFYSAYASFLKENHHSGMGGALDKIGDIFFVQKDYEQALENYNKSIEQYSIELDNRGLASANFHIAKLYQLKKDKINAEKYALLSYACAMETGFPENLRDASSILYTIYKENGDFKNALAMHELNKKMQDSLSKQDAIKLVVQGHLKIDFENKAAEAKVKQEKLDLINEKKVQRSQFISYASIFGIVIVAFFLLLIVRSSNKTKKANAEISKQKLIVEEKSKEVQDSIHYAKKIQQALLPSELGIKEDFKDSFLLFKPRDIVSGDFYWLSNTQEKTYIAVCDSTGHGVPGAFISLMNISFLTEAISEKNISLPNEIFNFTRERLTDRFAVDGNQDGMDGILLCIDKNDSHALQYSASNNSPIIIRNQEIIQLPYDKMPIGISSHLKTSFSLNTFSLEKGDLVIAYTDGFADQFGGPKGKKFRYKQLNEFILANANLPMVELGTKLENQFATWKGSLEQVDDVLIVGFRVS